MFGVLRNRRYWRLFTAQVVALIGTGLLTVALGLLAYDLAGSNAGAVLGTVFAIKMLAYVGVAPVISAMTERVPRRVLLVSADLVRAAVALGLPFVTSVWQIYVLIFLLQAASATFTPAFQALIPSILEDEDDYTHGLSLSRMAYDLEALLSPVLAAALLTVLSYTHLFSGTATGFVISAILVATTTLPRLLPAAQQSLLRHRVTAGTRIMVGQPVLRGLLAMNLAAAAATALVIVNTVVYIQDVLASPQWAVAAGFACYGGGSMAIALAVPRLLSTYSERQVMLTGCTLLPPGLLTAALLAALHPTAMLGWALLVGAWIALGAGTSLIATPSARLLRTHSDSHSRTAVFAAQFSLSHACYLFTYPLAGWGGAALGQPTAAVILAVVATLAATAAARVWPTPANPAAQQRVTAGRR